jgi:hypothetical protein
MKKIYQGKIPFRETPEHHQLDWYSPNYIDTIFFENMELIGRIQIESFSRGRSATNFSATVFDIQTTSEDGYTEFLDGCKVNIFMVDLLHILLHNNLFCGKSTYLHLAFCKRGSNYGLCLVDN